MNVKLGKAIQVDERRASPNEGAQLSPWLPPPDRLDFLQDALGMDQLAVEATEQFIGSFLSDILAKRTDTPDQRWILIENQREKS